MYDCGTYILEVYESTTEDDDTAHLRELMDELVIIHAKGVIDGLDHNCRDWLTRYDGKYCTAKMKEDTTHYRKENISLCESFSALFDLVYRMSSRFSVPIIPLFISYKKVAFSDIFDGFGHFPGRDSSARVS